MFKTEGSPKYDAVRKATGKNSKQIVQATAMLNQKQELNS